VRLELDVKDHLVKQYGRDGDPAVQDLSLEVNDGEFVCLLGPSGCGKTTTLRMIGGFLRPDSGDVRIDGVSILREPPERRPTAMVFQRYALWPHMSVSDNIAFGLQVRRRPRDEIARRVEAALELVGLPAWVGGSRPSFRAVSSSASRWPERWCSSRASCCWTSRSPTLTRNCASTCALS
jgi:ABC-type Fe3+/spermidine/putrescine transport system ATPase subunit